MISICDRPDPYPDKDPGSARCYGKSVVPTPSTKEFLRSLVPERAGRCAGTWGCHRGVVVDAQGREEPDEVSLIGKGQLRRASRLIASSQRDRNNHAPTRQAQLLLKKDSRAKRNVEKRDSREWGSRSEMDHEIQDVRSFEIRGRGFHHDAS